MGFKVSEQGKLTADVLFNKEMKWGEEPLTKCYVLFPFFPIIIIHYAVKIIAPQTSSCVILYRLVD